MDKYSIFLLVFVILYDTGCSKVLKISQGLVNGTTLITRNGRRVSSYIGIPYGESTGGGNRFKNPIPKKAWDGVFQAQTDGNVCPQIDDFGDVTGDEDCLVINVYRPEDEFPDLLPVMVFIYGGEFIKGNSSYQYYGPNFMLDRDIVLVTFNYRVSIFGFVSSGDCVASGNFGLKDQLMALKWVNQNVQVFGGDPERVTLFGQSAGAISIHLHVLSDQSNGLFQQYIMESGNALFPWAFRFNDKYTLVTESFAIFNSCPVNDTEEMIDCLRGKPMSDLLQFSYLNLILNFAQYNWGPTNEPECDGSFFTELPLDLIKANKTKDYKFMTGINRNEGLVLSAYMYNNFLVYLGIREFLDDVIALAISFFGDLPQDLSNDLAERSRKFYFGDELTTDRNLFTVEVTDFITDGFFFYPLTRFLNYVAPIISSPIYFYEFEYHGGVSETSWVVENNYNLGVDHMDELWYLFPMLLTATDLTDSRFNKTDFTMVHVMVDLWTSFAIDGVPRSSKLENPGIWTPYAPNDTFLRIGFNSTSELVLARMNTFYPERMKFWYEYAYMFPFGIETI